MFPHSDICGSRLICSSPQLFAACHVLHRRLMPRHPPYALISLILNQSQLPFFLAFGFFLDQYFSSISFLNYKTYSILNRFSYYATLHLTLLYNFSYTYYLFYYAVVNVQSQPVPQLSLSRRLFRFKKSITYKLVSSSIFYASGISLLYT